VRTLWTLFWIGSAASLWLAVRGGGVLPDKPFVEDSFYALGVSRNLGTGHGFTVDGATPTNGVQPLYVVCMAPLYWLTGGDRVSTLRAVFGVEWALWVLTALGVATLTRRIAAALGGGARLAPVLAALAWIGSGHLWRQSFNGLETGLHLCALVAVGLFWTARSGWTLTRTVALGALLGLSVLARIDVVFLVALCAAAVAMQAGTVAQRLVRAAAIGVVAALVSGPWWAYNQIVFGSIMPTSGQATAGSHLHPMGLAVVGDAAAMGLAPNLWLWDAGGLAVAIARGLAAAVLAVWIVRRSVAWARSSAPQHVAIGAWALVMVAFTLVLAGWYVSHSRMDFFYPRYLCPAAVVGVPFAAVAATTAIARLGRLADRAAFVAGAVLAAAAIAYPVACSVPSLRSGNPLLNDQLRLVDDHVPAGEAIGAVQSGTLSYFRDAVLNLDGKVNADFLRERSEMNRDAYMRMRGVRWFCDDEVQALRAVGSNPEARGWQRVATRGRFGLWRRVD
jgi:hypothetical protein